MNYPCANCQRNPVPSPASYCVPCAQQFSALPSIPDPSNPTQPWTCTYCGNGNQPGQQTCWHCQKVNFAQVQSPPPEIAAPAAASVPPTNYWQCKCGYAFNEGTHCQNCKTAKTVMPWTCTACGYEYSLYDVCGRCKNPKGQKIHPPPPPTSSGPPKPWTCPQPKCRYEYNMEAACIKCKAPKPNSRPPLASGKKKACCVVF